jgi:hypothetical protein
MLQSEIVNKTVIKDHWTKFSADKYPWCMCADATIKNGKNNLRIRKMLIMDISFLNT